jgi:alpha-glucosidase
MRGSRAGATASLTVGTALAVLAAGSACAAEQQLTSPDGALKITVSDSDGQARYAVAYKGQPLLAPSPLGLVLGPAARSATA